MSILNDNLNWNISILNDNDTQKTLHKADFLCFPHTQEIL
jgi:hypothetical protein